MVIRIEPKVTISQELIVAPTSETMLHMVTDPKEEFSERLNMALDNAAIPPKGKGRQIHVGKMFGVSQKGARKWLEGEAIPDTKRIPEIAKRLNVSGEWLLTGQGSMYLEDEIIKNQPPSEAFPPGKKFDPTEVEAFRLALKGIDLFEEKFNTRMDFDDKYRLFLLLTNVYLKRLQRHEVPPDDEDVLDDVINFHEYRKTGG